MRVVIGLTICLFITAVEAQSSLEARLARLEQQLLHLRKTVLDQDIKISQLQRDVQNLRGEQEVLAHKLEQIEQQQQDIYLDLDERLRQDHTATSKADDLLTLETTEPQATDDETSSIEELTPKAAVETPTADELNVLPAETVISPPTQKPDNELNLLSTEAITSPSTQEPANELDRSEEKAAPGVMVIQPQAAVEPTDQRYQQIFAQVQAGQYEKAIIEFQEFLMDNPHSDSADDAQYWLGESQYALKKYNSALLTFNALLKSYPNSSKIPHTLLKIGYIYAEQNQLAQAQVLFQRIKEHYPNSAAARLAQERLQAMTQP